MDVKDKKILYELEKDSMQPFSRTAKKVGLSPQSVEYRFKRFFRKGIIKDYMLIIAYQHRGYTNYMIYLSLQNVDKAKEDQIIEWLKKHKNIVIIWRCEGKWDLVLGLLAKNNIELSEVFSEINNQYSQYIRNYETVTHVGSEFYHMNFLLNKKEITKQPPKTGGKGKEIKLDKEEEKILCALIKNPRKTVIEIAEETGTTTDVVRYRIKKLKKIGVLAGSSIYMDYDKMGYPFYRIIIKLRSITKEKEKELFSYANLNPNIFRASKCFGNWEFTIDVCVKNNEELRDVLINFRNRFNNIIQYYETIHVYSVEKIILYPVEIREKQKALPEV